jgi:hypothetical protein
MTTAKAQFFSEWFQQKKTQKKYLLQQIAALQVYIGYVQKGYEIGKDGLNLVGDIKDGDFNLHKGYFKSLVSVNPEIKKYSRVEATVDLQKKITTLKEQTVKRLHASKLLTRQEQSYCDKVFERLMEDCSYTMDDLIGTATDGKLSLKDDERLQRIDRIYEDMSVKYRFAVQFSNSAIELVRSRSAEFKEVEKSLILIGIK